MEDFEKLKALWQQSAPTTPKVDLEGMKKTNQSNQRSLEKTQLRAAIALFLTPVGIQIIFFLTHTHFQSALTYVAVALISVLSVAQGVIHLSLYRRLRRMNVAAPATEHLRQWEAYYQFRRKWVRINNPVYTLALSVALGLYYIEILGLMSVPYRIVVGTLTAAWILYSYFVLGRRQLRKEYGRLESIIQNLKNLQQQLDADSAA